MSDAYSENDYWSADADKTAAILRERELDGGHKASETCPKCGESLAWSINREAEAK